jgi:hypothetical protein
MIACLDWSGSGEGGASGKQGGKQGGAAKGAKGAKGGKSGKNGKGAERAGPASSAAESVSQAVVAPSTAGADSVPGDRSLAPPMFVIAVDAPSLGGHRPSLDEDAVQSVFARKRAVREQRIAELVAEADREGRPSERIVAAIVYDSEHAPQSTNRRQLAEIGVVCPPPGPIGLGDNEVRDALWRIIYGLAYLGIYLSGTDHLDDRTVLRILCSRILDEEIRDVPPSRDMSEFIDLTPCRADWPDGLAGPFDACGAEGDGEDCEPLDPIGVGPRSVVARDRLLPRPRGHAM